MCATGMGVTVGNSSSVGAAPGEHGNVLAKESPRIDGVREWPLISVVTASYNQGKYIEQTIRSVIEQDYPKIEYIVIDGASKDDTVDVLKRYDDRIAFWVSEPDNGPAEATNRGFRMAKGEILCWINSDDWYYPGAFAAAAAEFVKSDTVRWVSGAVNNGYSPEHIVHRHVPRPTTLGQCLGRRNYGFHQPGMFWHREMVERCGPLDETLHFCFDHHFWIHCLAAGYQSVDIPNEIAFWRVHPGSKTCSQIQRFIAEDWYLLGEHIDSIPPAEQAQVRRWLSEYEAGYLVDTTYALLSEGRRAAALGFLLKRLPLIRHAPNRRAVVGALARVLGGRRCPEWWQKNA